MTEATPAIEPFRRNSRIVRDPGAMPKIVVVVSDADSPLVGEVAQVQVRCGPCRKRLYDVAISEAYLGADSGFVEDETLIVTRRCPSCGIDNTGRVTRQRGRPYAGPDALLGPWHCTQCGRSLGKVDSVRARITVTCECGAASPQSAIEAIAHVYHADT